MSNRPVVDGTRVRAWLQSAVATDSPKESPVELTPGEESVAKRLLVALSGTLPPPPSFLDKADALGLASVSPETASPSGEPCGDFVRLEQLAQGGSGSIYRALEPALERTVAMKVLRPLERGGPGDWAPTRDQMRRFLDEARVTGQLDHPGVVPVHAMGLDGQGQMFFTMRLVEGETLRQVFDAVGDDSKPWTLSQALERVAQAAETMAFAHSQNILHRDLKPSNIMVGAFGETYVMDWGLAKTSQHGPDESLASGKQTENDIALDPRTSRTLHTQAGTVLGTIAYMPPEQARGELDAMGPWSDVYSMGAVLYHLLAGNAPYQPSSHSESFHRVLERLLHGPPPSLSSFGHPIHPELISICEKAMARRPADRYASMQTFAADVRAHLENRVVQADRTDAWVQLKKLAQRNKGVAYSLASLALVVLLGFAITQAILTRSEHLISEKNLARRETNQQIQRTSQELGTKLTAYRSDFDALTLDALIEDAHQNLWPRRPRVVPAIQHWLEEVDEIRQRQPLNPAQEEIYREVEDRILFAEELEAWTLDDHRERWDQAIAEIRRSPRYKGWELAPEPGLIPLGMDPDSQLWEFLCWESGEFPERSATTGQWEITADTGIILVLLPGGEFRMGASPKPGDVPYDPEATTWEQPIRTRTVAPFFLSKYEFTQGQWIRLYGENPSHYRTASDFEGVLGLGHTRQPLQKLDPSALPVESVNWSEVRNAARRVGLRLPSEAEWEYACRAGTTTPWSCGSAEELPRYAAIRFLGVVNRVEKRVHALRKVGSLLPNKFGLFDMHGNVAEWCLDVAAPYTDYLDPHSPEAEERRALSAFRIRRGGGVSVPPALRSSARFAVEWDVIAPQGGFRPALSARRMGSAP